jgi:uncharacterized protein (TIGR03435 family)
MRYIVSLAALCLGLFAQQPLKFEVASIRQLPKDAVISQSGGGPVGSRLKLEAMSLSDLIARAYRLEEWQIAGGPAWVGVRRDRTRLDASTLRFDITAKAEGDAPHSKEDFAEMLKALLAERFHLSVHTEEHDAPVYALVQDKNGSKLKESAPDAKGFLRMNSGGGVTGSGATVSQLTGWFSRSGEGVDRPVIDLTGLTGHYDFTLKCSNSMSDATDASAPSVFTALPEQLGLKLEPRKMPMRFLVIDRAELPTEN